MNKKILAIAALPIVVLVFIGWGGFSVYSASSPIPTATPGPTGVVELTTPTAIAEAPTEVPSPAMTPIGEATATPTPVIPVSGGAPAGWCNRGTVLREYFGLLGTDKNIAWSQIVNDPKARKRLAKFNGGVDIIPEKYGVGGVEPPQGRFLNGQTVKTGYFDSAENPTYWLVPLDANGFYKGCGDLGWDLGNGWVILVWCGNVVPREVATPTPTMTPTPTSFVTETPPSETETPGPTPTNTPGGPGPTATPTPIETLVVTPTPTPTGGATSTPTVTGQPPTNTPTSVLTSTPTVPPSTATNTLPAPSSTSLPTSTQVPPTATNTPVTPPTNTPVTPPTSTPVTPPSTNTALPPTATPMPTTPVPPTPTSPPTATRPPTQPATPTKPPATATLVPPTQPPPTVPVTTATRPPCCPTPPPTKEPTPGVTAQPTVPAPTQQPSPQPSVKPPTPSLPTPTPVRKVVPGSNVAHASGVEVQTAVSDDPSFTIFLVIVVGTVVYSFRPKRPRRKSKIG